MASTLSLDKGGDQAHGGVQRCSVHFVNPWVFPDNEQVAENPRDEYRAAAPYTRTRVIIPVTSQLFKQKNKTMAKTNTEKGSTLMRFHKTHRPSRTCFFLHGIALLFALLIWI